MVLGQKLSTTMGLRVGNPLYLRIFNPDASGVGELVTRGRNVCMGYIWDEEKTRQENGQNNILRICHVTLYAVRMRKVTAVLRVLPLFSKYVFKYCPFKLSSLPVLSCPCLAENS